MSARARYADSVERQRLDLATVEQRIARARTLADRALDADDAAGADAALRAVARNKATRDDLAAADQQLADWRRRSPRTEPSATTSTDASIAPKGSPTSTWSCAACCDGCPLDVREGDVLLEFELSPCGLHRRGVA